MNSDPVRRLLPVVVAIICFATAFSRPGQRGMWLGLGVVFLAIGVRRFLGARKSNEPPPEV